MKRAIFKIGRKATVHSKTRSDSFRVDIDVNNWLAQNNKEWAFPIAKERGVGKAGTKIVVRDIIPGVASELASHDFEKTLDRTLGRDYAFFIQRGFSIKLNGRTIKPASFELLEGGDFEPARMQYSDSGVQVEIIAGMAAAPPEEDNPEKSRASRDMELFGWYVLCNERTILAADKTEHTVWGYGGVPEWHNQYSGFRGLVFFRSADPAKLPWTTTKRDIDQSSEVYKRALIHLRVFTKVWTSYTNRRKSNIGRAKAAERQTRSVSVLRLRTRKQMKVPKMQSTGKPVANILYARPSARVDRVRRALGDANLSNRDVGIQTFEYFYKREVNG